MLLLTIFLTKKHLIINIRDMKKIILFICLFALIGCWNKDSEEYVDVDFDNQEYLELAKEDMDRNPTLYQFLRDELRAVGKDGFNGIEITDLYFEEQLKLMNDYLTSEAYERLPPEAFRKRLNEVFGRFSLAKDIDIVPIVLPTKREIGCDEYREALYITDEEMSGYYYNASVKYGYITPVYHLTELIDYRQEFPSLALLEDNIIELTGSENYLHWKNKDETGKYRNEIYKKLRHRNLYLFHNNKNSFKWLTTYDPIFLEQLVLDFGYVSDKDLLKWVIDRCELVEESIWSKQVNFIRLYSLMDCNDRLVVHQEVVDMMASYNKEKHSKDIIRVASGIENWESTYLNELESKDLAKFYGYLFETLRRIDEQKAIYDIIITFNIEDDLFYKLDKEFEKANYYDFNGFKEFWTQLKVNYEAGVV
jgi:hypothetical protein